jgi:RecB family exonuclease
MSQGETNGNTVDTGTEEAKKPTGRVIDESKLINTTGYSFPKSYLSNSQIELFDICPRAYFYKYIDNKPEVMGPAALVGVTIHRFMEELLHMGNVMPSDHDMLDIFSMVYAETLDPLKPSYTSEDISDAEELKNNLYPSAKLYYMEQRARLKPVATEMIIMHPVKVGDYYADAIGDGHFFERGEITFVGFIDMINSKVTPTQNIFYKEAAELRAKEEVSSLEIVDYKTGVSKNETDLIASTQFALYAEATGIHNVRMDNIIKSSKAAKYQIFQATLTDEHFNFMHEYYSRVATAIGKGTIETPTGEYMKSLDHFHRIKKTGWKCSPKYCGYYSICGKEPKRCFALKK